MQTVKLQLSMWSSNKISEFMPAIFTFPVAIDMYFDDGKAPIRKEVWVDERKEVFEFDCAKKPNLMSFDGDRMLLGEITDNKSEKDYIFQYKNAKKFRDRFDAIAALRESENGIPV